MIALLNGAQEHLKWSSAQLDEADQRADIQPLAHDNARILDGPQPAFIGANAGEGEDDEFTDAVNNSLREERTTEMINEQHDL